MEDDMFFSTLRCGLLGEEPEDKLPPDICPGVYGTSSSIRGEVYVLHVAAKGDFLHKDMVYLHTGLCNACL